MDMTDRHSLPLLATAQAQKELTHNEAITSLSMLAHPSVESAALAAPPTSPVAGQMWIVDSSPTGSWAGQATKLALWTASGWRFQAPTEGMTCWDKANSRTMVFGAGSWTSTLFAGGLSVGGNTVVGPRQAAIATPSGGATVDSQARSAVADILAALRAHGLIAP
jgi:Protein of unknown function (DUF2793)